MNPLRQYLASCLAEREPKRKAYLILCLQMQKGRNKNDDDDSNNKNDEKKWVIGHISSASAFLREKSFLRRNKKCKCFDSIRSGGEQVALREGDLPSTAPHQGVAISLERAEAAAHVHDQFHVTPSPSLPAEVIHDLDVQSLPGRVDDEDVTPPQ